MKTILVVEDDPDLMIITSTKLSEAGFNVLKAHNGEEGLKVAIEKHPDLILLDYMMPEMTGIEMLKLLRTNDWGKDAHVFMLTSMNRSQDMSEGLKYNVAKYIIKSDMKYEDLISDINSYIQ
jgi:DNA-binding response OmpR family regulator